MMFILLRMWGLAVLKATIKYDLSDIEERKAFKLASNISDYQAALFYIWENFKNINDEDEMYLSLSDFNMAFERYSLPHPTDP